MADRDFSLNGRQYKLNKIDAFKQYHIVRRLAPVLADLIPVMKDIAPLMKDDSKLSEEQKFDRAMEMAGPLLTGLSRLSDIDSNHILHGLLASVEIQQDSGNWARISTGTQLMFQDMELPQLFQIAGRAFMFNISGFFSALPQRS